MTATFHMTHHHHPMKKPSWAEIMFSPSYSPKSSKRETVLQTSKIDENVIKLRKNFEQQSVVSSATTHENYLRRKSSIHGSNRRHHSITYKMNRKATVQSVMPKYSTNETIQGGTGTCQSTNTTDAQKSLVAELTKKFNAMSSAADAFVPTLKQKRLNGCGSSSTRHHNNTTYIHVNGGSNGTIACDGNDSNTGRSASDGTTTNNNNRISLKVGRKPSVKTKPLLLMKTRFHKRLPVNNEQDIIEKNTTSVIMSSPATTKSELVLKANEIEVRQEENDQVDVLVVEPEPTIVEVVSIPAILPKARSESLYEMLNSKKEKLKENASFLWANKRSRLTTVPVAVLPEEQIYEELPATSTYANNRGKEDADNEGAPYQPLDYDYCESKGKTYEYEYCLDTSTSLLNSIYDVLQRPGSVCRTEGLPLVANRKPLPAPPPNTADDLISNCYESIYCPEESGHCGEPKQRLSMLETNYESIYEADNGRADGSVLSSCPKTNSLYGRGGSPWDSDSCPSTGVYKTASDLNGSDRSDDWIDITDTEDSGNQVGDTRKALAIIRGRPKFGKVVRWTQQCREHWLKYPSKVTQEPSTGSTEPERDDDHLYESLYNGSTVLKEEKIADDEYDSFDSGTESETSSFTHHKQNESSTSVPCPPLPPSLPPPLQNFCQSHHHNHQQQNDVLNRIAYQASRQMRKLCRNWSLTKNDISKSLSKLTTKRKTAKRLPSPTEDINNQCEAANHPDEKITATAKVADVSTVLPAPSTHSLSTTTHSSTNSLQSSSRGRFLDKFRRSISIAVDSRLSLNDQSSYASNRSTFYLANDDDTIRKAPLTSPPPVPPKISIDTVETPPKRRSTSWYAEVGLFKEQHRHSQSSINGTCWYSEAGLYPPMVNGSTPSSSSAEVYTSNGTTSGTNSHHGLRLENEPLYQFYDSAVLKSAASDEADEDDEDSDGDSGTCLKRISDYDYGGGDSDKSYYGDVSTTTNNCAKTHVTTTTPRPSVMELVSSPIFSSDYSTDSKNCKNSNHLRTSRSLWCEIPEVVQSTVLSNLSTHQNRLQEAKFEMLTSEASYFNSLNVLQRHFIQNLTVEKESNEISTEDWYVLFGQIEPVRNSSMQLLQDMEICWQENILLNGICEIIRKHVVELDTFGVYTEYCGNQIVLDETLKRIRRNPTINERLNKLEQSPQCQSLTLYSFLLLPMQRITRWPLLIDAVLKRLSPQDSEYVTCQQLLSGVYRIVSQCNETAGKREKAVQLAKIAGKLEYAKGVPSIELIRNDRWLVRFGTVQHLQARSETDIKLTFGKRFHKQTLTFFLFNDYLFITKVKSENSFTVLHYCQRNLVEITTSESLMSLPPITNSTPKESTCWQNRHLLFLTLLENQKDKTVEFLISCESETDKERWIEAFAPPKSDDPDEILYECWDCPQVTAVHNYVASQPDELALSKGDVINVLRKMTDGWYHGERLRDGKTGWFPANHTVEIANRHVRSRNLKQRYRLLAFSEKYLKSK